MKDVALFKINTEGCEYETLEALLEWPDRLSRVRNLQVQFHSHVPNAQARYEAIAAGLSKTHRLTYQTPFVWESWTLK